MSSPSKRLAKPACKVGRHGYHQYELVKRTDAAYTWQCRLCGRRVRKLRQKDEAEVTTKKAA